MDRIKSIINTKYFAIILLTIWLIVIFLFSSKGLKESNSTSYKITDAVVPIVESKNTTIKEKEQLRADVNYIIRKTAHFTEYAILGILFFNVLRFYDMDKRKKIIYALIFCILYASSDEFHQVFSSGRSPMIKDVIIDSCGSLAGILIFSKLYKDKK